MPNLPRLRQLLRATMTERDQNTVSASQEIGMSQTNLSYILNAKRNPDVSTCLLLAHYMRLPASDILTLAGHEHVIPALRQTPTPIANVHPAVNQFAQMIRGKSEEKINAALSAASIILTLDKTPASP